MQGARAAPARGGNEGCGLGNDGAPDLTPAAARPSPSTERGCGERGWWQAKEAMADDEAQTVAAKEEGVWFEGYETGLEDGLTGEGGSLWSFGCWRASGRQVRVILALSLRERGAS